MTRSNGEHLRAGTVLGRYRIIQQIGEGGMGEVYRARDLDLQRDVAIKVLPSDLVGSEERVRRLMQEAKAASGLNHPNIVVVHEIGAAYVEGTKHHFVAMELVDGITLREAILEPRRDVKALLRFAAQAADALAKAHSAGIVHRDLKPDNLMITRDGFTKVLDFGVAKLTETAERPYDENPTHIQTSDGIVMGTIGYMSPEQAEGRRLDARSDIFSFGCILYEIATGERAFGGTSQVDILHAVVHADPRPVTDFNPTIPAELRRIIRRCLAKDPDQRFQTMKDLANALRDLVDEYYQLTPAGVSAARSISTSPARANPWPRLGVVALILIIAALVLYLLRERNDAETRPRADMRIMPVTTHGQAVSAAISPDGRYVVYTTYHRGLSGIRVRQLATNSEIDARPPTRETYYARARFSPDGERLYVLEFPGGGTTSVITTLPTLGGEPREVLRDVASLPAFSPDGKSLAFIRRESPAHTLFVANANGTNARAIATRRPPESLDDTVAWSPDGKWIAVITGRGNRAVPEMLSPDGKERRAITNDPWFSLEALEWIPDMSGVIAVGQLAEIGIGQLWRISLPDGHVTRVTNDLNDYNGASIAASGKSLATMQTEWRARIWRHDLAKNESTPITEEQVSHIPTEFELLADGSFLFHSSEGGESTDIWWLAPDGASKKQLTSDRAREFSPTAPRAGDVVYYAHESDTGLELWAMNTRGGAQRSVAKLPALRSVLDASPDGRSVLVVAREGLVLVSTSDGSRRVLTTAPVARATYSPDGRWIAARVRTPDRKRRTILLDANSGATVRELPIVEQEGIALEWTADSRNLISVEYGDGADNLWLRPVDGGAPRQLTRFTSDAIIGVQAPADGKAIYFSRGTSTADAVLVSNF